MIPRLVIAAPSSGSGKTTVATGLMAALRARGLAVSPHKVGPDYIDPGYHALAAGRPGRNLDPWLVGEELVGPLFLHGAAGCDVAVVEGVMGLFDGKAETDPGETGFASTAHVAKLLDAPVVLVVDAARQSASVAAVVHGFATFDPRVRVGGVVLNRVGSDRHEELCRAALAAAGVPVLGAIRRDDAVSVPSRHLGLVPAAERESAAVRAVERLGALVARSCDLDGLVRLAASAPPLTGPAWDPATALNSATALKEVPGSATARTAGERAGGTSDAAAGARAGGAPDMAAGGARAGGGVTVAVAGGAAFTFGYAEHVELLRAAGAEIAVFDPLRDERLPERAAALVIGGGFPELYAAELAANEPLREQVAAFGGPIAAECAGLLYLCEELDGQRMCGRVPGRARMTPRLTLGYRDAVALRRSPLTRVGERFHAHEFHRTAVDHADGPLFGWPGGADGYGDALLTASYLHLHWAGSPGLAQRLVSSSRSPSVLR
ncbi:cobyrinate a,c-diamide synthase [Nonomuraea jiangxiensis]|uniref:Hydrogenobyrinate a,c-diamide synthase n=1 Tax=Nonomuraea jiangxiensis TaxID=633440 RepID=A0A1G9G057_9ACTN|nr:cobyrinate a,c-diamide synthase [Nonomuraea jiangxiensis]SDK94026.1 cobyrinic acid a,c-diamide synthase [Nonomuraea jiangxiensis]